MKKNKILSSFIIAAGVFGLTACNDTDAQYEIPYVDAPVLLSFSCDDESATANGSAIETKAVLTPNYTDGSITVTFDKNIGFPSQKASQITVNGVPAKKALVIGVSKSLTIYADVPLAEDVEVRIPGGLINGPNKMMYENEIVIKAKGYEYLGENNGAREMTKKLGMGWNLGNHFGTSNVTWGYWDGSTPTQDTYTKLAATGIKTLRMPVTWGIHQTDETTGWAIDATFMAEVRQNIEWAHAAGLNVILNTHHDEEWLDIRKSAIDPVVAASVRQRLEATWKQIAEEFKNEGDYLIFESFNEIHGIEYNDKGERAEFWGDPSDAERDTLNAWNQTVVNIIRATGANNATRWIGIPGYTASISSVLNEGFKLPEDPANKVMVAVHTYDPYDFTLADSLHNEFGHGFGINHEEQLMKQFLKLRKTYVDQNIPCYIGEIGCSIHELAFGEVAREYYLEFVCRAAYAAGLSCMLWDNNNNGASAGTEVHNYINHSTGDYMNEAAKKLIPMMVQANTKVDPAYTVKSVYDKAPSAPEEKK